MAATLKTINARIETIAQAERVTKKELGLLSCEIFEYTLEHWDSQVINRLLAVLTPMNKRTAILYFQAFTPFKYVEEAQEFGGIVKANDNKARCEALMVAFLGSDGNIWTWAEQNVKVEPKEVDFLANITKNVKKAIESDKGDGVLEAVLAGGVTPADIVAVLAAMAHQEPVKEQAAVQ